MFVLGVGAHKAGTSWLCAYIRQSPQYVRFVIAKEHHVWDRRSSCASSTELIGTLRSLILKKNLRPFQLWCMEKVPAYYFFHLKRRLRNKEHITLDITPRYAGLSKEEFIDIRRRAIRGGIEIKVVFLMRDPIERCISSIRHSKRGSLGKAGARIATKHFKLSDKVKLRQRAASREAKFRANYKNTIINLEAAFEQDELFFGIYENFFEEKSIVALSDFLKIPPNPAFGRQHINVSNHINIDINDDVRRFIAETYKDTYSFCGRRFPETKELWGGFRFME